MRTRKSDTLSGYRSQSRPRCAHLVSGISTAYNSRFSANAPPCPSRLFVRLDFAAFYPSGQLALGQVQVVGHYLRSGWSRNSLSARPGGREPGSPAANCGYDVSVRQTQAHRRRSFPLGCSVANLVGLAYFTAHCSAGNHCALAPSGVSVLLAMEKPSQRSSES